MQHLSVTAFTCSLRREGCLMDKNKQLIWEAGDDVPTAVADGAGNLTCACSSVPNQKFAQ